MTDALLHFVYLFSGQVIHALARTFEADRAATDRSVGLVEVVWEGPERWRTLMLLVLIAVLAFTGSAPTALAAAGISADGTGMALLLIVAGYNLDSISKKLFALGKPKDA